MEEVLNLRARVKSNVSEMKMMAQVNSNEEEMKMRAQVMSKCGGGSEHKGSGDVQMWKRL